MKTSTLLTLAGLLVGALLVGYGASEGQVDDTRTYSLIICTSCLGIHEIITELSFQEAVELAEVQAPVELMLFTAEGCLDCPKAREFIESICQAAEGKVSPVEVDVRENQPLAEEHDIRYVPTVTLGDLKLVGLGEIRAELIPAIIEQSEGQS